MPRGQETKGRDWDLTEQAGRGWLHPLGPGQGDPSPLKVGLRSRAQVDIWSSLYGFRVGMTRCGVSLAGLQKSGGQLVAST